MVDCLSLLEDPGKESLHTSTKMLIETIQNDKKNSRFLCPTNLDSLVVRGHYGAKYFDYVHIRVNGCNLGTECYNNNEIMNKAINFISMKAHPSLLADNKDEIISYTLD